MLVIEAGNVIKITRGDTLTLTVDISKDGETYTPIEGDAVRFAVSKGYVGQKGYQLILTQNIPLDTLTFTIDAETTQGLTDQKYNYDVQMTHANGSVDTFISSALILLDEVE